MPVVWTYPRTSRGEAAGPVLAPPAVDPAGRLFLTLQNRLVAFGPDRAALWHRETGGHIVGPPTLGRDGRVRLHSSAGLLYCLDPTSGGDVFPPVCVGPPLGRAAPLVDEGGDTWICSALGGLQQVTAQGTLARWFVSTVRLNSAGVLADGVLYLGGEDGCVHAIALTGEQGRDLWEGDADRGRTGWYVNLALARRSDGLLVVASADDRLYLFTPEGRLHKQVTFEPNWQITCSPAVDESDDLYLAGWATDAARKQRGYVFRLDGATLQKRWAHPTYDRVEGTPLLGSDGTIYVGDLAGVVHAIDRAGKRLWAERMPAAVRTPGVLVAPGRLGYGLQNGTFVVLACASLQLASGWPKYLGPPTSAPAATC